MNLFSRCVAFVLRLNWSNKCLDASLKLKCNHMLILTWELWAAAISLQYNKIVVVILYFVNAIFISYLGEIRSDNSQSWLLRIGSYVFLMWIRLMWRLRWLLGIQRRRFVKLLRICMLICLWWVPVLLALLKGTDPTGENCVVIKCSYSSVDNVTFFLEVGRH